MVVKQINNHSSIVMVFGVQSLCTLSKNRMCVGVSINEAMQTNAFLYGQREVLVLFSTNAIGHKIAYFE